MATNAKHQHWSQVWLSTLRTLDLLASRTTSGSRIRRMEVAVWQVIAEVQERTHGLCQITIQFAPLAEEVWSNVLDLFQQQLAGAPVIEPRLAFAEGTPAFQALCTLLFPSNIDAMQSSCSCCSAGSSPRNCPALQTVYRQLGTMLDEEPVLLLRLRGHEWQEVVRLLQRRRENDYSTPVAAPTQPTRLATQAENTNGPLASANSDTLRGHLSNFWGSRKQMEQVQHHIASPLVDLAILRRLGPLPDELSDPVVDQQLAMLYRLVSREAEALAYDLESGSDTPTAPKQLR